MKAHRTDGVSLVFGLLFVLMAGWWLVDGFAHLTIPHIGWFAPAALIALGLLGIVASLRSNRRTPEPVSASPTTPAYFAAPPSYVPPAPPAPFAPAPFAPAPFAQAADDEPVEDTEAPQAPATAEPAEVEEPGGESR
jgi:hypothetical protein